MQNHIIHLVGIVQINQKFNFNGGVMKHKFRKTIIIFCAILILLIEARHTTPSLAVRTKLFCDGHPIAAIITSVKYNWHQQRLDTDELDKMNAKIYAIKYGDATYDNGTYIYNFIVKKVGNSYYADYWGEM